MPVTSATSIERADASTVGGPSWGHEIEIGLLTGCQDRPYVFGLSTALALKNVSVDVIGSDEVDGPEMHTTPQLHFLNMRKSRRQKVNPARKVSRLLVYYFRLIRYAANEKPKILHILWNNKFEYFDRTLLMLYYKRQGKKIVLTVHNVNQARRDAKDSLLNRVTLRIQYRLADHSFVHTQKMKSELIEDFGVKEENVTIIPFGINNAVPQTDLTVAEAKRILGIQSGEKVILFFGRMRPYKGLEHLLAAYERLSKHRSDYRLIVAGEPKKGSEEYIDEIRRIIQRIDKDERIVCKLQFIPDEETELYFKAADVLALPYKEIFQSGVMFLAYSFGLPVIAANVGSFSDEIVEGRTGFLCNPSNADDFAGTIDRYFASELYRNLDHQRSQIMDYANEHHSWSIVAEKTTTVYAHLLEGQSS
jgi:glycosyltransferase involved in cell wall biosynthesis